VTALAQGPGGGNAGEPGADDEDFLCSQSALRRVRLHAAI
jgi:hypothetical protein